MKIGIITILKVNNYGAELQAYALQRILNNLGFDAEIIDYLFYKNPGHKNTLQSKPLFRFGLKKRLAETIYPLVAKGKTLFCSKAKKNRDQRFEAFHKENTRLSRPYRCVEDLLSTRMDYDISWSEVTKYGIRAFILHWIPIF